MLTLIRPSDGRQLEPRGDPEQGKECEALSRTGARRQTEPEPQQEFILVLTGARVIEYRRNDDAEEPWRESAGVTYGAATVTSLRVWRPQPTAAVLRGAASPHLRSRLGAAEHFSHHPASPLLRPALLPAHQGQQLCSVRAAGSRRANLCDLDPASRSGAEEDMAPPVHPPPPQQRVPVVSLTASIRCCGLKRRVPRPAPPDPPVATGAS
ncbi:hypothetical protein AAFF_G00190990 [Aldrovandia affinis]|uniref:Uncharacterized protein n=1 Tax=Aldrovandia affinis TaxID=143900 RepID=A0AAD7RJU8_9TELE|nr:hypothetical protein AAFF_G00190990 [Aldrovandia affinis]